MTPELVVHFQNLDAVVVDERLLSPSERERVARKGTPQLRQRQAASFQWMRAGLGAALGQAPERLAVLIDAQGKPYLQGRELHFNLSHSGAVGMLAWGPRALGVDVEALIARPSDGLADEILCAAEQERWRGLDPAHHRAWLTRTWTRKEAVLKAVGSGLRIPPRSIDVGGGEGEGRAWALRL